jgi:hypothetical protein
LKILEGALAIGRQANALAPEVGSVRLRSVQQRAALPTSTDEHLLLAKVHGSLADIF